MLDTLKTLVLKDGLMLGGLPPQQRQALLALVWAGLPEGAVNEPQINQALKAQLQGPALCLDTDHVELRRWLVDAGWLLRDGYGRQYQRAALGAVPAATQSLATSLLALNSTAWAAAARAAHQTQRQQRRQAWQQEQGAAV